MSTPPNPYKVLGVSENASTDEIKKAYRKLAREYHPDSTGGDKRKEERFKRISAAYQILGDPEKRKQYDAMASGHFPGGMDMGGGLGDLFAQFFGGQSAGNSGVQFEFRGGSPFQNFDFFGGGPRQTVTQPPPFPHTRSKSTPKSPKERKIKAPDGSILRQKGNTIHSDVRLGLDEAILGCVKNVSTIQGSSKLKIPPGTSSGVKLRMRGKGVNGGDHIVTVQITVPKKLDAQGEKLLQQFIAHTKK